MSLRNEAKDGARKGKATDACKNKSKTCKASNRNETEWSAKRARQEGSELMNPRLSPLVAQYVGKLKEERLKKFEVSYEGHIAELARLREAALKKGSFSSAVNAATDGEDFCEDSESTISIPLYLTQPKTVLYVPQSIPIASTI